MTRRRASWAGVIGFWQRAQGSLAERAVLASEPSGGSAADRAQADRAGIGHREADPAGAEMIQVGLCYPLADRHPASALSHPYTVAPAQRGWDAQQPVGVVAALTWVGGRDGPAARDSGKPSRRSGS